MLSNFLSFLILLGAFQWLFSLDIFYFFALIGGDVFEILPSNFWLLSLLFLFLFTLASFFWLLLSFFLWGSFGLYILRRTYHDSPSLWLFLIFIYSLLFCASYYFFYFFLFFFLQLLKYYKEKDVFLLTFFRKLLFNIKTSPKLFSTDSNSLWYTYIYSSFLQQSLFYFYLRFFLIYFLRYIILLFIFFIYFIIGSIRYLLCVHCFFIFLFVFYIIYYIKLLISFLSISLQATFIASVFSKKAHKIAGRLLSYDDFSYRFSNWFFSHFLALFYASCITFTNSFPFPRLLNSLFSFSNFLKAFLLKAILKISNLVFSIFLKIRISIFKFIVVKYFLKFIHFLLKSITIDKKWGWTIIVVNFITFYFSFLALVLFSLKKQNIKYINILEKIWDSILFFFFIFINSLWSVWLFFYIFLLFFIRIFFIKLCILLSKGKYIFLFFLLLYILVNYPLLGTHALSFISFLFTSLGGEALLAYWIEIFSSLPTELGRKKIEFILENFSNFSMFHTYFNKSYWDNTLLDYLNFMFYGKMLSLLPFDFFVFYSTSAYIWFIYYLSYFHYHFLYLIFFLILKFSLHFPTIYYIFSYVWALGWGNLFYFIKLKIIFLSIYLFPLGIFTFFIGWYIKWTFFEVRWWWDSNLFLNFILYGDFIVHIVGWQFLQIIGEWSHSFYLNLYNYLPIIFFKYPITYFSLPYYGTYLSKIESLLSKRHSQALWEAWGFYSRPGFDSLAYRSPYALDDRYSLSPIASLRRHTIEDSLKFRDSDKIFIMLDLFDRRYRSKVHYSFSLLHENNSIARFLEVVYLNDEWSHMVDIGAARRKKRRLAAMIPLLTFTTLYSFTIELLLVLLLISIFIFLLCKALRRYISISNKDFYNPQALWSHYSYDFEQHYIWFVGAIFLADRQFEVIKFQEWLHASLQNVKAASSAWKRFYEGKDVSFSYSFSLLVENLFTGLHHLRLDSFYQSLLFSEAFWRSGRIDRNYFYLISWRDLVESSWLEVELFSILEDWAEIEVEKNLLFENIFPLEVVKLKKFHNFFDHFLTFIFNWDNFILKPFTPRNIFAYYVELFSLFYKDFNMDLYISRLIYHYDFELTETYDLSVFFKIVYENSFVSVLDVQDDLAFTDFSFFEIFLSVFSNQSVDEFTLIFFSTYYHDFLYLYKWDMFENSLFFYDSRTANMSTLVNIEVDIEDNLEEEDEALQALDVYDYFYFEYLIYDAEEADIYHWLQLEEQLREGVAFSLLCILSFRRDLWLNTLIESRDLEEYIPDYLIEERVEFEVWDYTEEIGYSNFLLNYYFYEEKFWKEVKLYFLWMDKNIFTCSLPWWSFHKDYFYLQGEAYSTLFGKQYLINDDYSEIFPIFFYWVYTLIFCLAYIVMCKYYLLLLPFLKLFFGYIVWSFVFTYIFSGDIFSWLGFYEEAGISNLYFDKEIGPFVYFIPLLEFFDKISYPLTLRLESTSHFSNIFYIFFSFTYTMVKFFIFYLEYINLKIEWILISIVWWIFILKGFRRVGFVVNRFILYDIFSFRWVYFLKFKLNLKRHFLYDLKN